MKFVQYFFIVISVVLLFNACQQENNGVAPRNPNGESELAGLMLDMLNDGLRMKKEIEAGKLPTLVKEFEAIHTAQATEPEKVNSPTYKSFALAYQESLRALKNANLGETTSAYNHMVQSCMNCHQVMCPGPIVRIKKMYIDQE